MKRATYFAVLLASLALQVHAAPVKYVTDELKALVRSGTSTRNQILQQVPSGTPLTVLQADDQTGYTKVRTPSGTEGWILTRYLTDTPSARQRLGAAEKKLSDLENTVNQLRQELASASQQRTSAEKEASKLSQQNSSLTQQLAEIRRVSGKSMRLASENRDLQNRITELQRENQLMRQENASLKDRSKRDWFIVGAIVVVVSMLFGILLTRIRWRKRSSWGEL